MYLRRWVLESLASGRIFVNILTFAGEMAA
jgi:hypothetical protein